MPRTDDPGPDIRDGSRPVPGGYITLAKIIKERMRLVAICNSCGREAPIDLQMLVQRLGPEFKPGERREQFGAALKCTECFQRGARIELRQTDVPGWGGAHSGNRSEPR